MQVFDFQHDKADDSDDNVKKEEEHGLTYESDDLDFFNEELVDDVVATLAKKNGEIKNKDQSPKLARRMSHSGVGNYDAESSKELLKQPKKHVVKKDMKKTQLERNASSESTEAPTGKIIFFKNHFYTPNSVY